MVVNFYHLTQAPLERILPSICERLLAEGTRVLLVGEAGQLARLDEHLWTYAKVSFLPHGRARAESQPILLSTEPEPVNGATAIALADGLWREDALRFERAYHFFDTESLDGAREAWRGLRGREGVEPRYWKQDDEGKWVQGP